MGSTFAPGKVIAKDRRSRVAPRFTTSPICKCSSSVARTSPPKSSPSILSNDFDVPPVLFHGQVTASNSRLLPTLTARMNVGFDVAVDVAQASNTAPGKGAALSIRACPLRLISTGRSVPALALPGVTIEIIPPGRPSSGAPSDSGGLNGLNAGRGSGVVLSGTVLSEVAA